MIDSALNQWLNVAVILATVGFFFYLSLIPHMTRD